MSEQQTRPHVDRRALVRAGVWSVPAVAVAVAAPAVAASGVGTPVLQLNWLSIYGADYTGSKAGSAESQTAVQNVWQNGVANGGPTLTQVTLTVTYQNKNDGAVPTLVDGTGWSFASVSGSTYTFVWVGSLTPGGSTPTLTWRVALKKSFNGDLKVSAAATANGAMSPTLQASTNL
ncbi:MAG TPA: hypothetical protein VHW64_13635 [Nocardioides sp.]|jgi:hypothetical protein|uniref:hypothetical protein n=1 Tax=Nocardioides sp. TaxID=35761 RepID=UPI002E31C01F|nr:hypothetical protein [Nocardioides sp.]HEX3931742.1 hypothetical protein [Nocardioides sp.]